MQSLHSPSGHAGGSHAAGAGESSPAAIHPEWFAADLRGTSSTWRLLHLEAAADCNELQGAEPDIASSMARGWSNDASALLQAAFWTAEAIWRQGLAGDRLTPAKTQRARQIGTALLGPKRAGARIDAQGAAWDAAALFSPDERSMIRLQLPPQPDSSDTTMAQAGGGLSSAKAQRLVAFACDAMHARSREGSHV